MPFPAIQSAGLQCPGRNCSLPSLVLLGAAMAFAGPAWSADEYTARYDDESETMAVRACFDLPAPTRLLHHELASRFSDGMHLTDARQRLRRQASSSPVPDMGEQRCLAWQVNLGDVVDIQAPESRSQRDAFRIGPDLVMDPSVWLWRGSGTRELHIRMELPAGINVSVPWEERASESGVLEFQPQPTPASWTSRFAIGRFATRPVPVQGTDLRLAILGGLPAAQQNKLSLWIAGAAGAVSGIYGAFPRQSLQVLVIPIGTRQEPVPWAHVLRGGGPGVEFFVDESQPLAAFAGDWTACHELSHLLLPFVSSQDRWLSEGLASYYQYILMARTGALSEQQAWQGLYDGIKRGENDTRNITLADATRAGFRDTMRVYWSGAAMMLLADVRLRTDSNGAQSLDTILHGLRDCCINSNKRWRALDLFTEMDRISGARIFSDLYQRHVHSRQFPDTTQTWQALGIDTTKGVVSLKDQAELTRARTAIMSTRPH